MVPIDVAIIDARPSGEEPSVCNKEPRQPHRPTRHHANTLEMLYSIGGLLILDNHRHLMKIIIKGASTTLPINVVDPIFLLLGFLLLVRVQTKP